MRVCLTGAFLGASRNLVVEGDTAMWSEHVPRDAWVLDRDRYWPERDVATVAQLAGVDVTFPDEPSRKMMRTMGVDPDVTPWTKVLPGWKTSEMVRGILGDVQGVLGGEDRGYYVRAYEPSRRLVSSLARVKVDMDVLRRHMEVGDGNVPALESFVAEPDGFARRVEYDLLTGRTGRMKVESGPQILTLLKSHRDIIRSRFEGGKIVVMDYASLEARIAAFEAGHDPPEDIYTDLSDRVLGGAPRSVAKVAVLATLFGAGEHMLERHVEPGSAGWLMDRIRDHFKVSTLTMKLRLEREQNGGFIRSRRRRRVPCRAAGHILFNSYVQATGVDVALEGFCRVVEEIRNLALISVPVLLLHDACIVDVHPDELVYIDRLCSVGSVVECYERSFPLKAKGLLE